MKITLITAIAATALAPIVSHASDKEVANPKYHQACACRHQKQVALFVSGSGIGDQSSGAAPTQTVVQTGQGNSITFFTGER